MLRLLHTADWHLGRLFPQFPEDAQKKLSRARMDVVAKILDAARRNRADAILAVGDIFDHHEPEQDFWRGLAEILNSQAGPQAPLFLVPGNHDPLMPGSVWEPGHPFRARLPAWVHVVDRDDFEHQLGPGAVLYARPCRSRAGQSDLAMALPARRSGDDRLRIGCVHGSTFDIPGHQTNFPIRRDAGVERGLDYLAIGDQHSFRDVTSALPVPTVYPGAPEATDFGEGDAGSVAVVAMFRHGMRPRIDREQVGSWKWMDVPCRDMNALRRLMLTQDLHRRVLRLHLNMVVDLEEKVEVDRIVKKLEGSDAAHALAGVLLLNRTGLRLRGGSGGAFPDDLPPVLRDTVARLDQIIEESTVEAEVDRARRALAHLYKMLPGRGQ